jgi:hypothetical protein
MKSFFILFFELILLFKECAFFWCAFVECAEGSALLSGAQKKSALMSRHFSTKFQPFFNQIFFNQIFQPNFSHFKPFFNQIFFQPNFSTIFQPFFQPFFNQIQPWEKISSQAKRIF